ncbi:hypothetical protein ANN_07810 [Periplaneta americana]|uniref:Uncharacterized protein n=1 Tax=Periplaneta americana TaxID=6978 RepID=A0ABQ8T182_PERAM|nr:hypothetical protein ANN_07810 [Periplaneta americana]
MRNTKSRRLRWGGYVARMGKSRNTYRALVGKLEGKRPLGRPRRRWEDIKMDLREVGNDDRDWINLAQDRDRWRSSDWPLRVVSVRSAAAECYRDDLHATANASNGHVPLLSQPETPPPHGPGTLKLSWNETVCPYLHPISD